jgi:hypothetical protein
MKHLVPLVLGCLMVTIGQLRSETLYGPGTINIATNETILINDNGAHATAQFYLDDVGVNLEQPAGIQQYHYALTGPLTLTNFESPYFTFQRLHGSAIKTVRINPGVTNIINVPTGKTIQFFDTINDVRAQALPLNSTNVYDVQLIQNRPTLTGPVTIEVWNYDYELTSFVSYYFTDEVLQLPTSGLLAIPAPILEVNVEKSYNLTNWAPTAAFHTDAEAGAFYRLRMLK